MDIEEAIKHCEDVAKSGCTECEKEHQQLRDWLIELKELRKLIEEFYYAAERLDEGFITAINSTPENISGMNGDQYDNIMDVFIKVGEYLGVDKSYGL